MNQIPLRALRPSHALAYLAALGLQRIVESRADPATRLSWAHTGITHALLHTTLDREQVLSALEAEWDVQADRGTSCLMNHNGQRIKLPPK